MQNEEIQRLFKQYYAKMYRVARTILYDEQESKDVVSDIFEGLLYGQTMLLPDTEERYLMASVRNQCLKRLRHEEVKHRMEEIYLNESDLGSHADDERITDIIEFAVTHLTAQQQRIFALRFDQGCSYDEIAQSEGISKVAVWKHLSHIINTIKNHFNQNQS